MFNRTTKNENQDVDINQDVTLLADTLDGLLKSYGSKSKDEVDEARSKAQALLKETRAKLNGGGNRVTQVAKDAGEHVDTFVRDNPWHGVGIGAAIGVFLGALIATNATRD